MCIHDPNEDPAWDFCAQGVRCLGHRSNGPSVTYVQHDCTNQCRLGIMPKPMEVAR